MADDFCSANVSNEMGVIRAAYYWYINWTGRFSANFAHSVIGLFGPRTNFHTSITLLLWFITLVILIYKCNLTHSNIRNLSLSILFSTFILSITLSTIPTVGQSLYWAEGMLSTIPPLILLPVYLSLLICSPQREKKIQQWNILVAFFLTLFAGGFSETYNVVQISIFIAMILFFNHEFIENDFETRNMIYSGLAGSVLSLIVLLIAPGNAHRISFFPHSYTLFNIFAITFDSLVRFLKWIFIADYPIDVSPLNWTNLRITIHQQLSFLCILLLSAIIGRGWIIPVKELTLFPSVTLQKIIWRLPPILIVIITISFIPAAYGTSTAPPGRTFIIPQFIFIIGIIIWGYAIGNISIYKYNEVPITRWQIWLRNLIPIFVVIVIILNAVWEFKNLVMTAPAYRAYAFAWEKNNTIIRESKKMGLQEIVVPQIYNPVFGFSELTSDRNYWINTCVSGYYGISVITKPTQ
jgi:hypothetical protein